MLDERQQRVLDALGERSEKLAGIYRSALGAFGIDAEEGYEAARISIVCHCMRELMIGLPAVMAEKTIPRPKPTSGSLVHKLPELLGSHPELDLALDQDLVPVPREVARAVLALVTAQVQEVGRNRSQGYPSEPTTLVWCSTATRRVVPTTRVRWASSSHGSPRTRTAW
ncbi:MAG: hypothetical protein ACYDDU_16530, partial [Dermatophilaceae bacterium]